MLEIPIYSAEKDISDLIKRNTSISHLVQLQESEPFELSAPTIFSLQKLHSNLSERKNFDLFPLQSLLVSSVWNGNDDYFAPIELWLARSTAKDKPVNYEHDENDIIGHTIHSYIINDKGEKVEETLTIDELPDNIHVISGAVLYTHWEGEDKKKRMEKIISEIKNNEWYVSVECLFPTFDYLLKSENNEYKLVVRNEKTAFLTKYLRAYKGTGVYNNQKIARVPRNLILSGKGLVRKPANALSVIFASQFEPKKNNLKNLENNLEMVYEISEVNKMNEKDFAELNTKYTKLENDYAQLKASVTENKTKELSEQLSSVTKAAEASVQEINALKAGLEKVQAEKLELGKLYDELGKQKKDIEDKLVAINKEKSYNEKLHLCQSKLGMDVEKAKNFIESVNLLTDEAFANLVNLQASWTKGAASETTIVPDVNALNKTEKENTPSLGASDVTPTKTEEVSKLSAGLVDYMKKNNIIKTSKARFLQEIKN